MIEYVFKPTRKVKGRTVRARLYSGRYTLGPSEKPRVVALHTPDERVARKKLRDHIVRKQREAVGLDIAPALRDAAAASLVDLVAEYRADLSGRGLESGHVRDTCGRILRVIRGAGWARLSDVRPDGFMRWRSASPHAAKTKREYQASVNAFLAWLVRSDRLEVNPLAKVDQVEIRGKQVRQSRAFTVEEFARLLASAPAGRRLVYQFLAYTGARKNEARSLCWSDVSCVGQPSVLFRAENTKSARKRAVPLKRELSDALAWYARTRGVDGGMLHERVFQPFPSDDALHSDLRRAGIERKDGSGRVLHFHAFRKTFQTWGAVHGVGQRSAQELLGHSDPSLTANVYTDVAALALHQEVAKLPWVGGASPDDAHIRAQIAPEMAISGEFRDALSKLIELAQVVVSKEKTDSFESVQDGCPTWIRTMTR